MIEDATTGELSRRVVRRPVARDDGVAEAERALIVDEADGSVAILEGQTGNRDGDPMCHANNRTTFATAE